MSSDHEFDPDLTLQLIEQRLASATLNSSDGEPPPRQEVNDDVPLSVIQSNQNSVQEQVDEFGEARDSSERGVGLDMDDPSCPSSSGCVGERGSTIATSASAMHEVVQREIQEIRIDDAVNRISDSRTSWLPGKRHWDEVYIVLVYIQHACSL